MSRGYDGPEIDDFRGSGCGWGRDADRDVFSGWHNRLALHDIHREEGRADRRACEARERSDRDRPAVPREERVRQMLSQRVRTKYTDRNKHYSLRDEILALRWGRIDLLRGTLLVAETCYKGHFGTPKTRASRREVPLAPVVVRELKKHYSLSADHSREALVFSSSSGVPLAANNLRRKPLGTACKRAGLQRIDWHTLRHTHGTLLHSQGTPLKVAQAQLGHSHMATTLEIYTHASGALREMR